MMEHDCSFDEFKVYYEVNIHLPRRLRPEMWP
jgi:hypothetical protein